MQTKQENKQVKTKQTKTYGQLLREARGKPHGKKKRKKAAV